MTVPFCIPPSNKSSWLPISSPAFGVVSVVISPFCFNLQFSNDLGCWTYFHMLCCGWSVAKLQMVTCLLWWGACSGLLPSFNQFVHFLIVEFQGLCILCNSPSSYMTFVKYFLSYSFDNVFHREEIFNFKQSPAYQLFLWWIVSLVFLFKNLSPCSKSSMLFPMLSSRSLIVLHFTCRLMIYSELIFVKGMRSVSRFIFFFFFACGCTVAPTPLKRLFPCVVFVLVAQSCPTLCDPHGL